MCLVYFYYRPDHFSGFNKSNEMSTMGSFKKKMALKTYRERSQPSWHKDKGFLEKKVDYVKRAKNYNLKKKMIGKFQEKAELKNDYEFDFKMIKAKVTVE